MTTVETLENSVARAEPQTRAEFIKNTYIHVAMALVAFAGIEALLVTSGFAEAFGSFALGSSLMWFVVLAAFIGVSIFANNMAMKTTSKASQYAGLSIYVIAEAVIFSPLIWIAAYYAGATVLPTAIFLTLAMFGGLTFLAFFGGTDYSFLGRFLKIGGFVALGIIVAGMIFGFNLGLWFSGAMIAFASGSILYETSNIIRHYNKNQYVAASLSLFASVALLFWYILSFLLSFTKD